MKVYADHREMLGAEKDLDAVIIATPDWVHAEQAIACLNAGVHVYCEKEMSNTIEGARSMVEGRPAGRASCSRSVTSGAATRGTGMPSR